MDRDQIMSIPAFSFSELKRVVKHMRKRRSPDMFGVVVELIQYAGNALPEKLLKAYNEIIPTGIVPQNWHCIIFSM